jgi:hypothetical protein
MQALLTLLVTWLSVTAGLPPVYEHPRILFVAPAQMAELRLARVELGSPAESGSQATAAEMSDSLHAIYDDVERTIYLPAGWRLSSPRDLSLLVHELVHHLQNAGGLSYDCPAAREKPAYRAQARWLEYAGESLEGSFGLDPMTLLVRTSCLY